MPNTDGKMVIEQIRELLPKTEMIVILDVKGEIIGGFARKEGDLRPLTQIKDLFNGNRKLEDLSSITMVKVSSSPGHWAIIGGRRVWVPY